VSEKLFQVESNGRQTIEGVSENVFLTVSPKENFSMKAIHQADEIKLLMDENANETLRKISAYMHKIRFAPLWDDAESLGRALSAAIEHQRPLSIQMHKYLGVA
jgi:organic radical activating enzyme